MTAVVPIGNNAPGEWVDVTVALQLSEAVGAVQFTVAPHAVVALIDIGVAMHPLNTGKVSSLTCTLNVQVVLLPDGSVAV